MRRKCLLTGILLTMTIVIFSLGAPAAMAIPIGDYNLSFDTPGLPDGSTYTLTIEGIPYSVTSVTGADKTIVVPTGLVNFAFSTYAQVSETQRREYNGAGSTASPVMVSGDTTANGGYTFVEYRLTFDQEGLPPGTNYYVDWGWASAIHNLTAGGARLEEWQPNSLIYVGYQNPVPTPLGTFELGNVSGAVPSGPGIIVPGSFNYTINGAPVDFVGHYISGSITGTVFWDYNNNSIQDPGEPGVPGATVELWGNTQVFMDGGFSSLTAPGGLAAILSTISNGNGGYTFNFLPAGTFFVRVTLPGGGQQDSPLITLSVTGGAMNSGQANFPELAALPYTGK